VSNEPGSSAVSILPNGLSRHDPGQPAAHGTVDGGSASRSVTNEAGGESAPPTPSRHGLLGSRIGVIATPDLPRGKSVFITWWSALAVQSSV
jgi:hypothetical protein